MDPPSSLRALLLHNHGHAALDGTYPLAQSPIAIEPMEPLRKPGSRHFGEDISPDAASSSAKRPRIDPTAASAQGALPRPSGACTRCKKVKMRCTFSDNDNRCARCIVGEYECIVPGRKPRSPGMRDILRKQIREKDAMIDQLLNRLNPSPSLATPLSVVPSRLALTPAQRAKHASVLGWLEKIRSGSKTLSDSKAKVDVSALEDGAGSDNSVDDDEDEDDTEGECTGNFLHQLAFVPEGSAPAGMLASASLACSRNRSPAPGCAEEESQELTVEGGIGCKTYFQPGPSTNLELRRLIIERQAAPDILLSGLINYKDVSKLFDIYFKSINSYIPILDENIHTPAAVLGRCPFLFTVVCSLASRYYDEKPDIYVLAMHLAKGAAGNAFLGGWKTIEMCQAYVLLGAYSPPARRWEEDRSWFYSGVAFRLAIELNLNRIPDIRPMDERNQRELLNRIRTWIVCYVMDRCICVNLGKPFMIPEDDTACHAATKFLGWKYQQSGDGYLVSLTELLRIITRFSETVNLVNEHQMGIRHHSDLVTLHNVTDIELAAWKKVTEERCGRMDQTGDISDTLRRGLMFSVFHYCRLVTFSAGLQQVIKQRALKQDDVFFAGCLHAACAVLTIMLDDLIPTGLVRCSPEHVFTLSAFATAVLIKFLRPQFASKLDRPEEDRIIELVKRLLDALDVEQQGLDDHHAPRRYAQFFKHLLSPHIEDVEARRRAAAALSVHGNASMPLPAQTQHMEQEPFQGFEAHTSHSIWDDTLSSFNQEVVPMPPILGFPDPGFLASMFSYAEQVDQTRLFY